jgi:integrating conjugative element membrane protein (TIGR03747 family)
MAMASRNASFHDGVAAGALLAPLKFMFTWSLVFFGILLAAWSVDWMCVFKVWPDGVERLRGILAADLARGTELAARQGWAPGAVSGTANVLYGLAFRFTGIHDMALRFAAGSALSIPDTIVRNFYVANREGIEVAMIGTQLFGVRMATLAMILPLLLLVYIVGATDGLCERAIRRACRGRESASLYHRAKHLQVALTAWVILATLLWPAVVDVLWSGMPLTLVLGICSWLQWTYYKKHL